MLEVAALQDDALRRSGTDDEVVGSVGEGRGRSQGERGLAATGEEEENVKHFYKSACLTAQTRWTLPYLSRLGATLFRGLM